MREAVIVSTARTPIGRAYRGAFNDTQAQELIGHAVRHAVERAGVEGEQIEDVVIGAALQQGSTAMNIGRQAALRAGLPVSVAGMSVDRQCASGLMAIATAAKQVILDGQQVAVGGGVDSISLVQNEHMNTYRAQDPWLVEHVPATYMSMLETAEVVARRYGISREAQDEYALRSQQRIAIAQQAGLFADEIIPIEVTRAVIEKATGEVQHEDVTFNHDECNRPTTTLEGLAALKPVKGEDKFITAGNASQLSDGAAAVRRDLDMVYTYFPRLKERRRSQAGYTSGGEQQMTAMGRALMSRPETILLDEPSMGLAPQLVEQIFQIVKAVNEGEGVTFLLAEQNTNVALRYAHYGYILESGRVVMDGEAAALRENPDVKEFYLGMSDEGRKSFRDVRSYRRRKRWLA